MITWWPDRERELGVCLAAGELCVNPGEIATSRDAAAATTLVMGGAGLVLLATGAILAASPPPSSESGASFRCLPAAAGLACAGRF